MSESGPLLDAVQGGRADEVARLLDSDPALLQSRHSGVSAVRIAVYHRHPEIARLFVDRRAGLDVFDASALGETARLRDLLAADPALANAVASDGFTPLGLASFFGHPEAARLLLANGADPNLAAQNSTCVAPLHSAVAGGSDEIVRELLAHGADVHARQDLGFTALHGAAVEGSDEMIGLLLDHGADPYKKNDAGKTPVDLAREQGREQAAQRLLR
jgi:ankyrin repeat protein